MTRFSQLFKLDDKASLAKKPRDKMEALLEAPNTSEVVQALDAIEFYDLYHAVGPSDAMVLLEYASSEQLQTCLDLDIWRGDQVSDDQLTPWVEQMLTLPDEKFEEFWNDLDPELMALYLHRNIRLYMAEDKNDDVDIPEGESPNVAQTPDFTYWVAYPEDTDKAELLRQLVDRLYAVLGIDKAWSTLEGMHFEMESDLEETAYRFRTERIREYGFMPREEAAAIFANVDVAKEAARMRNETNAELYVQPYSSTCKLDEALVTLDEADIPDSFFEKILASLTDRESIKVQLLALAQQVAVYDGYQPHEMQGFADSMKLAIANINMGLEFASEQDEETARRLLTHIPLKRLFSLGYSLTIELQRRAKILIKRGVLSIIEDQPMSLLTTTQRDAVEGMLLNRPRPAHSALTPFFSLKDIQHAAAVIADIATRELFFGEGLHKTRDDISRLAYTHEIIQGIENVNFDNVATTFLTRKYLGLSDAWNVIMADQLPKRSDVIQAVAAENIFPLFRSNMPESSFDALRRFAYQLRANLDELWPESEEYPDPKLMPALLIAECD
ncbi:MAG: hypothetical protein IKY83_08315 [Proteobacteria bacterium]|nr:hypothetical protein [Pseudomonadota bacterium]